MQNNKKLDVKNKQELYHLYENEKYIVNERENIKTDLIRITKDKLEIILLKEYNSIRNAPDWKSPASVFFTALITVLTATFKDFIIPKEIWNALFILLMLVSGILLLINIFRVLKIHNKDSIDYLINKIANIEEESG